MFLSRLLINIGDDPDRPRPGRQWLKNLYHVHQRLCMAFPSKEREKTDEHFLKPFKPEDFCNGHVHVEREANSGFLFRIDPHPNGRAVILVQSAIWPDWEYAFHNACHLLAANPECKKFDPSFKAGQRLRFRLVANPMKKIDTIKKDERQSCTKEELRDKKGRHGRRVPVPTDQLYDWLIAHEQYTPQGKKEKEPAGFSVEEVCTIQPGYVYVDKTRDDDGEYWEINATEFALPDGSCKFCKQPKITPHHNCLAIKKQRSGENDKQKKGLKARLRSVRYEGVLEVTDADKFRDTLLRGIGPGKAFGFGLLSVAPVKPLSETK